MDRLGKASEVTKTATVVSTEPDQVPKNAIIIWINYILLSQVSVRLQLYITFLKYFNLINLLLFYFNFIRPLKSLLGKLLNNNIKNMGSSLVLT